MTAHPHTPTVAGEVDAGLHRELTRLRAATEPGAAHDLSADAAESMFARVVWARLVEPGDAVAGAVIGALGATRALRLLVDGADARAIAAAIAPVNPLAASDSSAASSSDCVDQGSQLLDRIGPKNIDPDLIDVGEADAVSVHHIAAGLGRWLPRLSRAESIGDLERARSAGLQLVLPGTPLWPPGLDDLGPHAPLLLWVRGTPAMLSLTSLAVVGARACTSYGAYTTAELVGEAGLAGVSIVSGAAYGIDAAAHRAALATETPTVAVLAGGADRAYPLRHDTLLDHIAEAGAVCSEMIPGAAPTRWRFLQRNRIIAALSRATLVTEAGHRSGSLNTAGHASNLGRPLGAVPGPITSAASAGCHRLLREYDATLVTGGSDLRELLGLDDSAGGSYVQPPGTPQRTEPETQTPESGAHRSEQEMHGREPENHRREPEKHRRVADALPLRGSRPTSEIARLAGLSLTDTRGVLAEMDLLGRVSRRKTPDGEEPRWALQRRQ